MFLVFFSLCLLTSSKIIYAYCDGSASADCVSAVPAVFGPATGETIEGKIYSAAIPVTDLASVDRVFFISTKNADKEFEITGTLPPTLKEIISVSNTESEKVKITTGADFTIDYVCSYKCVIEGTKIITAKSLDLREKGTAGSNVKLASAETPILSIEADLDTDDVVIEISASIISVNGLEIPKKAEIQFTKITMTNPQKAIKLSVKSGQVVSEGTSLILNFTKITGKVPVTFESSLNTAVIKVGLSIIVKDYDNNIKLTTVGTIPYTIIDAANKLIDQFPLTATSYAICLLACTAPINDESTLYTVVTTNTELDAYFDKIKDKATKVKFASKAAVPNSNGFILDKIVKNTVDVIIIADSVSKLAFDLTITAAADLELKSLKVDNVALTIASTTTKTILVQELELKNSAIITAPLVTYGGLLSCAFSDVALITLKKINKLHASIDIDGTKNLEFIDNGYKYGLNTITFADTAAAGIVSVNEFNLTTALTKKTKLTVKAATGLKNIRPLAINVTKFVEPPEEEEPEPAQGQKLLADDPLLLEITFDDTWKEVKGGETEVKLITAYSPTKGTVTFDTQNLGEKYVVVEVAEAGGTPPPNPKPEDDGLSAGAIAGIVIACIAVVAGICVGVFFYIKKSKTKVGGAAQP